LHVEQLVSYIFLKQNNLQRLLRDEMVVNRMQGRFNIHKNIGYHQQKQEFCHCRDKTDMKAASKTATFSRTKTLY